MDAYFSSPPVPRGLSLSRAVLWYPSLLPTSCPFASATDFRASIPPSYPNHVKRRQWGPLNKRKRSCVPYQPMLSTAAVLRPCSTNTLVPTDVPRTWPIKIARIRTALSRERAAAEIPKTAVDNETCSIWRKMSNPSVAIMTAARLMPPAAVCTL